MESNKITLISIAIFIIVAITMNLIPSKTFFGPYYLDLYVILPLFLIQLSTLLFHKKNIVIATIINVLIVVIMFFLLIKML